MYSLFKHQAKHLQDQGSGEVQLLRKLWKPGLSAFITFTCSLPSALSRGGHTSTRPTSMERIRGRDARVRHDVNRGLARIGREIIQRMQHGVSQCGDWRTLLRRLIKTLLSSASATPRALMSLNLMTRNLCNWPIDPYRPSTSRAFFGAKRVSSHGLRASC